ncbi:MAG: RNA polymerase sigma factor [Lachnospiraceae bacterium]|nr:RNA polymerase sigma factor [Lachnospiraceae bacterium]
MDLDFLLIQKMKMGDEQAINVFVRKYYPEIFRYCRLHIRDYGYAEDMTQETFVKFFGTFGQYRHYGKVLNYLYVIAANVCKDYYRKKSELTMEELPEKADCVIEKINERLDVCAAVEKLPEELKEVAILFFFQEIKQKEIGEILGIGLPLVKYRIKRARELLSSWLGKENGL